MFYKGACKGTAFFWHMQIIFCILHEISMKLQKTNTKKIEKTATRVAVFNLRDASHFFNFSRRVWNIYNLVRARAKS